MVQRSTKFTGICIVIYITYALFVFLVLPLLLPDPVSMSRSWLAEQTRNLGNISHLTLEAGGQPIRSLLVTFRGSGAISLLDYLSRQPGCYHHFSPLIAHGNRITDKVKAEHVLQELISLYNCDYNHSLAMLNAGMKSSSFINFYGLQRKMCLTYSPEVCWEPETLSQICKIFPFINMSVYNMGLVYLAQLLQQRDMNIRILLLVRDPRATMASRAHRVWCVNNPECSKPVDLCSNMVKDYEIAQKLVSEYPHRFGIVRYEELALNPLQGLKAVFDFYGLPLKLSDAKPNSEELKTELKKFSIYFDRPVDWLKTLTTQEIMNIQATCAKAMELWGYRPVANYESLQGDTIGHTFAGDFELNTIQAL